MLLEIFAFIPLSRTAFAVSSQKKYMSEGDDAVFIISAQANFEATYTLSGVKSSSAGKIRSLSQREAVVLAVTAEKGSSRHGYEGYKARAA